MCQCEKPLVAKISGKTSDMCSLSIPSLNITRDGCVPSGLGIGSGDYLSICVCLACGQLQNFKPLTEKAVREAVRDGEDCED